MSFNSKRLQNFSVIFGFSLLEWWVLPAIFDYVFAFRDIGQQYIFASFEIGTNNRKSLITQKPQNVIKLAGTVLLSGYFSYCSPLLKELRKRFFELEVKHCTLTENSVRRFILFHWYCNFNPPTRLNDVWYLCNAWYFSQNEFFQFV